LLPLVNSTADAAADPFPGLAAKFAGARSFVGVPMLKDDMLIGAILVYRQEVRPFDNKQISLLTNFAAQAVIAIENARLLNELRQRTADLTEALEQQTATSEVLQVISSSPGDLEPVFASMLEKAIRVCEATFGNIYRWDGEAFYLLATKNTPQALAEYRRSAGIDRMRRIGEKRSRQSGQKRRQNEAAAGRGDVGELRVRCGGELAGETVELSVGRGDDRHGGSPWGSGGHHYDAAKCKEFRRDAAAQR
jgi:GAF domain